ncbi:MAG TPA: DNA primase [Candidatus Paceibacterota bacterium]|nr:DNA primase [Candidatus Paceibacterota bacterium]
MQNHVEQIKDRLSIVDVVGQYVKLEKSGVNFKAKCPFHNEKTASFFVSPDRGSYYCFGCGAKGDIFSFVEAFEGVDFMGALKTLAAKAGIELTPVDKKSITRKERLFEVIEAATQFFEKELSKNPIANDYILKRGVTQKTIGYFRIGYASDEWRLLKTFLASKGFTDGEMFFAGLIKKNEKGDYYDVFRGRIMFPIADSSGRIIAFSGRTLDEEKNPPKYLNTPETELFKKADTLFGLDKAKSSIRKSDHAILVEGQMDLVMSHQAGFTNTVASSGTAFGEGNASVSGLALVTRLTKNLKIAFDSDDAGIKAALRAARAVLALGMDVKIVDYSGHTKKEDPADIILRDNEEWKRLLVSAKHVVLFVTDMLIRVHTDRRTLVKYIPTEVLPFVASMEKTTDKAHFIKEISEKTGIREDALWEDLKTVAKQVGNISAASLISKPEQGNILRRLIGVIEIIKKENTETAEKHLAELKTIDPASYEIYEVASAEDRSQASFESEIIYGTAHLEKSYKELLFLIEEESLSRELEKVLFELHIAEKSKDSAQTQLLLKKCGEISKRLNQVKQSIRGQST